MKQNMSFIVLRATEVNERASVISVFTREIGRAAFLIPAGRSREALRMRALMQPLSVAEGVADTRACNDLLRISQCRPIVPMNPVYGNPVKTAVAMFVAEVLGAVLRQQAPDEAMFDYTVLAIRHLGLVPPRHAANFHICFLLHLARLAGVEPDWESFAPGRVLDLDEGLFRAFGSVDHRVLDADESAAAFRISRMTFANLHCFRFSRMQRNRALDVALLYMSSHFPGLTSLKSLDILRTLF